MAAATSAAVACGTSVIVAPVPGFWTIRGDADGMPRFYTNFASGGGRAVSGAPRGMFTDFCGGPFGDPSYTGEK